MHVSLLMNLSSASPWGMSLYVVLVRLCVISRSSRANCKDNIIRTVNLERFDIFVFWRGHFTSLCPLGTSNFLRNSMCRLILFVIALAMAANGQTAHQILASGYSNGFYPVTFYEDTGRTRRSTWGDRWGKGGFWEGVTLLLLQAKHYISHSFTVYMVI